jgi:hypothetical protein
MIEGKMARKKLNAIAAAREVRNPSSKPLKKNLPSL